MLVNVLEAYASETGTKAGKAGNSNGKELRVAKRDANDFDYIIRFKFKTPREIFVNNVSAIVKSKLCGYSQYDRYSLYECLGDCNFNVSKFLALRKLCNCDCSSLVMTMIKCLRSRSDVYDCDVYGIATYNMLDYFNTAEARRKFKVIKIYSNTKPIRGDILLKNGHTCIVD